MYIDKTQIEKVFYNLLSNAFKYTKQEGTIRVSVRVENNSLILQVYNTGKGISESDLQTIFDRFRILGDLDGNNYTQMISRNDWGFLFATAW